MRKYCSFKYYSTILNMDTIDTKNTIDRFIIDFQKLGFKNILALGHYKYKNAKQRLATHIHSGIIEICYFEKGTQYYMVDGKDYLLKGGDLLITYPGEPHGTSSYPEERGSLYWMLLKVPVKKERILNLSSGDSEILIKRFFDLRTRHFRGLPGIKNILTNIFKAYQKENEPLRMIEINSNILAFLLTVIHSGELNGEQKTSDEIELICKYVKDNLSEDFQLEELASIINLSVSRFKHRFKEEKGIPPKEFVLREKINEAKKILMNSTSTISDIAYDLGFYSPSYFATVFKRFTMLTPTEYRLNTFSTSNNI